MVSLTEEPFYVEPPYHYRPSVVEYLTKVDVTKSSIIADLLHMDQKGNINIEAYGEGMLLIKLKTPEGLSGSELFLWDFLKRYQKNDSDNIVELKEKNISKEVVEYYGLLTRRNTLHKFYFSPHPQSEAEIPNTMQLAVLFFLNMLYPEPRESSEKDLVWLKLRTIFLVGLLNIFSFWFLILSLPKISSKLKDLKTFARVFIVRYLKLTILQYLLFIGFFLALLSLFLVVGFVILPLYFIFLFNYWYKCALFSCDFYTWLFEKKTCEEHRREWLKFKKFVCDYSELENKSVKYYELWGEFYYYALAVGAIKNPLLG